MSARFPVYILQAQVEATGGGLEGPGKLEATVAAQELGGGVSAVIYRQRTSVTTHSYKYDINVGNPLFLSCAD